MNQWKNGAGNAIESLWRNTCVSNENYTVKVKSVTN